MRIYAPSRMQSVKDLPGQTKLKFRCVCLPLWRPSCLRRLLSAGRATCTAVAWRVAVQTMLEQLLPHAPPMPHSDAAGCTRTILSL